MKQCYNLLLKFRSTFIIVVFFAIFFASPIYAQNTPVIKVDMNKGGRQDAEVNDPAYISWAIVDAVSAFKTIDGVTIKFTKVGPNGTGLTTQWYKAGLLTPYFSRLASDGIMVAGGDAGAQIEMRISGLSAGTHTLLTYHNTFDSPLAFSFSPINIYVNGVLTVEKLMPSNRALTTAEMPTKYFKLEAKTGADIVLLFAADNTSNATQRNVTICGFEINSANVAEASRTPDPLDRDEHVQVNNGAYNLQWTAAPGINSHQIYFGTDLASVTNATLTSSQFKGTQSATSFSVSNLNSLDTYYWRVDEVNSFGLVTIGTIWRFRTRQLAFPDAEGYGAYARGGARRKSG